MDTVEHINEWILNRKAKRNEYTSKKTLPPKMIYGMMVRRRMKIGKIRYKSEGEKRHSYVSNN